ncbi:MAG: ribosome maturation factor RimP [Desulfuromonadales bacterium]|jgi:ribosome maturation factor RimP|nr:ribosome maturation factor RimP [Desulfuromonadales bacterium]MDH3809444.1 ribosome maturation factor RimP [Desulfuromonadales bacterium]MDH3869887.1 ribosome maturation factor RimP [Desulfuromonadales bacterium]MDH4023858.1 ribosome maturation factor RimP [Desulfuromonadales bacterium]HKJ29112.1 ribosome maturation factor RimP [Desulfuromonadales bacterium]
MREDNLTQIETLVLPILDDLGYELVDLQLQQDGKQLALRIFVDKPAGITLDDCVEVSREVSAILEVEDPIRSAYRLEVSSPGLDRPLKKAADFERFVGKKARLKSKNLIDPDQRGTTRKTFVGTLLGFEDDNVRLELTDKQGGVIAIPLADLDKANLEEEF